MALVADDIRTAAIAGMLLVQGCAYHQTGLVETGPRGTLLVESDGKTVALVLGEEASPVKHLGGHLVDVRGQRFLRNVRVGDWRVPEGLHGMAAWVGPLTPMGSQLGVQDRNSGAFYLLDAEAESALRAHAGQSVLLEGYVDGPHRIKVLYYRVLATASTDG